MKKWPKQFEPLTEEQRYRSNAFMKLWHEELVRRPKYNLIERFNHNFSIINSQRNFISTLEIGAGLGEHLNYERLTPEQEENYYCIEYRENMASECKRRFPKVNVITGDCQKQLNFKEAQFDRVIATHVLEHLPDLPSAIKEMRRVIKPDGLFLVVIPTEGSLAYTIARKISAERLWNKNFKCSYKEFIGREHINLPNEILEELSPYFTVYKKSYFPTPLPFLFCNLCIGLVLKVKR